MFEKGYTVASEFTQPLVIGIRFYDGTVEGGLGSFIILNEEGWLLTAAHNIQLPFAYNQHQKEIAVFDAEKQKILDDRSLSRGNRKNLLNRLKPNPRWVTHFMIMLGPTAPAVQQYYIYGNHDLAFLKIDPAGLRGFTAYPKIRNGADLKTGMSLCKLGFPFVPISFTFDLATNKFDSAQPIFPIPRFPIEGIYTRNIISGNADGLDIMWLETSSPGLKGQSGGPIFDTEGNICALQSQNITIPLGFTGEVEINGKKVTENQFMNVGIGVHAQSIAGLLTKTGIKFEMA